MVYVFLGKGFEEIETIAPVDILRRGGVEVSLVGIGEMTVTGAHNISVQADLPLEEVELTSGDMLVLPGGLGGMQTIEGSEGAMELIRKAAASEEIWLCAICASPTILGRAGLLVGKNAVCYPGMESGMSGAIPHMERHAVTDGKLITGRAPGAAYEFGFALLSALKGNEATVQVRNQMHV